MQAVVPTELVLRECPPGVTRPENVRSYVCDACDPHVAVQETMVGVVQRVRLEMILFLSLNALVAG